MLDTSNDNDDVLSSVKRNSAILTSLTQGRAPPPKNRRRPSFGKSCAAVASEDDDSDKVIVTQKEKTDINDLSLTCKTMFCGIL